MRTGTTIAGLLALALTAGCSPAAAPPQQQIDVAGIRSELLAIGQAEGHYLVSHSRYATLEELQQDSLLTGGADRRGYHFTAVPSTAARATPSQRRRRTRRSRAGRRSR